MTRIERIVVRHQIAARRREVTTGVGPRRHDGRHESGKRIEASAVAWPPLVTSHVNHHRRSLPVLDQGDDRS